MAKPTPNTGIVGKRPSQPPQPLAPSPSAQSTKKLPFAVGVAPKSDSFPIVSAFSKANMQEAIELMQTVALYNEQISEMEEGVKAAKTRLAEIAIEEDVPGGMRWGNFVVYAGQQAGRRMFKPERLLEHGVGLDVIEACYVQGESVQMVKVVDLSKPKKNDKGQQD